MNELGMLEGLLNQKLLNIHTAYLGRIKAVNGSEATIQPLTLVKAIGGVETQQKPVTAVIPPNIKYKTEKIRYKVSDTESETKTVLVPDTLAVDDIVYVGVCERDITYAKQGIMSLPARNRHHNINDGVILRVL